MSRIYDNWGRLVEATLKREKLRELGLALSRDTSFSSSTSASFGSSYNFKFTSLNQIDGYCTLVYAVKIRSATSLMDKVIKAADAAFSFKPECIELKRKTQQLKLLLQRADSIHDTLFQRPLHRIVTDIENVLHKAARLVMRCHITRRIFANISPASFKFMSFELEYSIRNVSWLLRDGEYLSSPPIAADEPSLCYIWELIAVITMGSVDDQVEAAASLASLASDDLYGKLIIRERGVQALLSFFKRSGQIEGRRYAARAILLLEPRLYEAFD